MLSKKNWNYELINTIVGLHLEKIYVRGSFGRYFQLQKLLAQKQLR